MDREERLKMLFEQDVALLKINTRLKTVPLVPETETETQPEAEDETQPEKQAVVQTIEKQDKTSPLKDTSDEKQKPAKEVQEGHLEVEQEQKGPDTAQDEAKASEDKEEPTEASLVGSFCPLIAVSRFPYKYIRGELSQQVANAFFDGGKFWDRCWDVHYIHIPPHLGVRPLLLVPAVQVRRFLAEINQTLGCELSLPTDSKLGFVVPFHDDGTPQPTFIGQCTSRDMKDELETRIPPLYPTIPETEATWNKKKSSKSQKKQQVRIQTELEWTRCLRRTQSYLGLRAPLELIDDQSWEDKPGQEGDESERPSLDVNKPVPYPLWNEPVFISVDVESNERCHSQVTEVGISTLDTLDLVGIPPGESGINWISRIRSRHFRVREYSHIVNREFIAGCPEHFEFGESEWVSIGALVKLTEGCFQPPYSCGLPMSETEGSQDGILLDDPEFKHRPRNLVLVGHNPTADIGYLRGLGMTLFDRMGERFIDTVDTAEMFRIIKHEATQRSLGHILAGLGITGWHLHNAGNDARYTMEAMVGMMLVD
ncbi:hypothetical protein MW887_001381 [Aspergillus wentii]|nr:hypothetical protein MW887_001381 [Aspergillus wentii]